MTKAIDLPNLPSSEADEYGLIEFPYVGRAPIHLLVHFWRLTLSMAMRDDATSVHFYPWRADCYFSMIVRGMRMDIVPPPEVELDQFVLAAATMMSESRFANCLRTWFGWPLRTSGTVRLNYEDRASDWFGTVWSAGGKSGAEWYRLPAEDARRRDRLGSAGHESR